MAALAALFAVRVVGQALQRWAPQAWLPPADAFQGSGTPYVALLASQLVILALMARFAIRVARGTHPRRPGLGLAMAWLGALYLAGSVARLVIGAAIPSAPPWFHAWIPGMFHLVLATAVLVAAWHHRRRA